MGESSSPSISLRPSIAGEGPGGMDVISGFSPPQLNPRPPGVKGIWGMSAEPCSDLGGRSFPVGDVGLNRSLVHGSTRHVICRGRVEASGCGIPGAMTSRGGADAAPGHLRQFVAALTMQWSVDRPGAPDVCLSKDQPHGWVETVGAGGRKVRKLLRSGWVECRLSSAPPISMNPVLVSRPAMAMSMKAHCPIQRDSLNV